MKLKVFTLIITAAIVLAACSPTAAVEEVNQPVVQEAAIPTDVINEEITPMEEQAAPAEGTISYSMDIMPVLVEFAQPAHSVEGEGGVFLETYEDVVKYVIPGDPAASELYKRLIGDGVDIMPPSGKLPDATIQLFYDWIAQGALNN